MLVFLCTQAFGAHILDVLGQPLMVQRLLDCQPLPKTFNSINPHLAKLIYLNFQPLEVVSRDRDPQPQVVEIPHICLI